MAIEASPYSGASQGHFAERFLRPLHPGDAQFNLSCIAAELLTQSDGSRILQMSSTDLYDPIELARFAVKGLMQARERRKQLTLNGLRRRNVDGGRNDV